MSLIFGIAALILLCGAIGQGCGSPIGSRSHPRHRRSDSRRY